MRQLPVHPMYHEQLIFNSVADRERARVDLNRDVPVYIETGHVEGFLLSKHICAPSHHLYARFVKFPLWSLSPPPDRPTNEDSLLASVGDGLWREFGLEFSEDLKAGYRNHFVFLFVAATVTATIVALVITQQIADPFFTIVTCLIVSALVHECLRESLFDKVDGTVARYQSRFAEKNIRASVVYYVVRRGKLKSSSRYLVFTALAHPLTINIV